MAKIKDTITYPVKLIADTRDMVIITDIVDGSTKNMLLGTVATLNSGVVALKEAKHELSTAQVLALVTTPFILVPPSVTADTFIVPVSVLITLNTVTTAYAFNGSDVFSVNYTTPNTGIMSFTGAFLNSAQQATIVGCGNSVPLTLPISNQSLVLTGVGNTASATGDSTLKVTVQYTEMTI